MKKDYCRILRRGGFLLVALTFCLLTACSNLWKEEISDNTENQKQSGELAYITLGNAGFSQPGARDIFPSDADLDKTKLTNIVLTGTWQPGQANTRSETFIDNAATWADATANVLEVQTGTWNFSLSATMNGIDFSGTLNKTVTTETTSLDFVLTAPENTTGGLALTVVIPNADTEISSETILTVNLTLKDSTNSEIPFDPIDYSDDGITFTSDSEGLPAGVYDLEITIEADGITENLNTYKDKLHIVAGITTTKTINMRANPVYDIAYKFVDGTLVATSESGPAIYTRKTATISLPTNVTKTGYTFTGWYEDASTSTTAVNSIPSGSTGPKNYYARFTPNIDTPYVVNHWKQKLNATGTEHNSANFELDSINGIENLTGVTDDYASVSAKDTTSGSFLGFVAPSASELTAANQETILPSGLLEINLYYERQSYNVTYADGQGNTISGLSGTYKYGATVNVDFETPQTRTGYDFTGWKKDSTTYTSTGTTSFTMNASDVELVAQWSLHEYSITYHYTGATLSGDFPESYTMNTSAVIPGSATATKTGYIFVGWFLDEDATESPITTISQTTVGSLDDVDLYAYFSNSIFVSANGDSTNDGLRPATAVDTVATAVSKIVSLNKGSTFDWNIAISGTVTGIQTISNSSLTSSVAKSVTLTGEDSDSVLNGGSPSSGDTRTTLTINTTYPITITNLRITGGCGTKYSDDKFYGGGLYLNANSVVKLGDGVMITGNACDHGGGVFVESGAKLFMFDDSYVGDPGKRAASESNLFTGREYASAQYANSAWSSEAGVGYGGGILNYGSVYLGYSEYTSETDNTPQVLTGGVYGNAAFVGGGIYNGKGDSVTGSLLVMNSGNITQNVANQYYDNQLNFQNAYGGGVYNYSTFILTENTLSDDPPTLSDNKAKNGGGAVFNSKIDTTTLCEFTIKDGTISGNTSQNGTGGGVYNNGIVTMSNGSFDSNIAGSDGAAVSNYGEFVTGNTGEGNAVFTMTGGSITNCKATNSSKGMSSICFNSYATVTLNGAVSIYYQPNTDGQDSGYISCMSTLIIGENFFMSKDPYTLALKYTNSTVSVGTRMIIDYANDDWCTDTLLINEGYHLNGSGEIVAD